VPTVWHINEGHAAFLILVRCRECVASGLGFNAAWALVASGTVFTAHTPAPAGHDVFSHALVLECFDALAGQLGIALEQFFQLGSSPGSQGGLDMTALALRGSRFHKGVSRIHAREALEMEG
jgi:starch phosphorylase